MKKATTYTNQFQRRHLRERMAAALSSRVRAVHDERKENRPAQVKKAEQEIARLNTIVHAYTDGVWKAARAEENRLRASHSKVMEKILFSDPQEALRLVCKFEQAT